MGDTGTANLEALKRASNDLREVLVVASKTVSLLADSLEPDCAPSTHNEIVHLAEQYVSLVIEARDILVQQATSIASATNPSAVRKDDMTLTPEFLADPSLAARTEAEIAARKAAVLADRLRECLPDVERSNPMDMSSSMI